VFRIAIAGDMPHRSEAVGSLSLEGDAVIPFSRICVCSPGLSLALFVIAIDILAHAVADADTPVILMSHRCNDVLSCLRQAVFFV